MVKKGQLYSNMFKDLVAIAASDDENLSNVLNRFLDVIVQESEAEFAYIKDYRKKKFFHSSHIKTEDDIKDLDTGNKNEITSEEFYLRRLPSIGEFLVKAPKNPNDLIFWDCINGLLVAITKNVYHRRRTNVILNLVSEIRRTLNPRVAIEKLYDELGSYLNLSGFYFFKKKAEDQFVPYLAKLEGEDVKDLPKLMTFNEVASTSYVDSNLKHISFESKVRDKLYGVFIFSYKRDWNERDNPMIKLFAEQVAITFNQHELHEESLSTAQREFLLNQITRTIRESLEVDEIIEIASQEIAQIIGVEACGISITDQKISCKNDHAVWSPSDETSTKMKTLMKRSFNSEYAPSLEKPIVNVSSFLDKKDSLATFYTHSLGVKSYLSCALKRHDTGEILGSLSVAFFKNHRTWTEEEVQLLESIGAQLETALTQAAIYQESQQTKMQMDLLHRLSSDIRESLEISEVMEQIASGLGEVLNLNRCFVRRFTEDHRILKTEKEYTSKGYFPSADIIFDFEEKWIKELSDMKRDGQSEYPSLNIPYVKAKLVSENSPLLQISEAIDLKSYLCVPLIARDKILGTINVHQCDRERNFLEEEIEFVSRVASEAAVAIQHAQLFQTIDKMSKTDPDTGLYNKRYFAQVAEEEIAKAKKLGKPLSYIIVDLDHLKEINDTPGVGGHEAGDEAIWKVAQVLEKAVRQTPIDAVHDRRADLVARFGGDEFMILLHADVTAATSVANRILETVKKIKHSTWNKTLTISVGVAGTPNDDYDYESLKTQADKALYLSKENGRAQVSNTLDLSP